MNRRIFALLVMALLVLTSAFFAAAAPNGVTIVSNTTVTNTPQAAASVTTLGGTFTTMLLNATTQTMRWKAFVGNVSGTITLDDATNATIYDWNPTVIAGEVYASRNSSISWGSIQCAQNSTLGTEESHLNITTTKVDSINRTFNQTVHRGFYVGTRYVGNSTCRAIATYVNNTRQTTSENATFQEILLDDTQRMVYATILENKAVGYNTGAFDFQMIVAENEGSQTGSTYYFWAELS